MDDDSSQKRDTSAHLSLLQANANEHHYHRGFVTPPKQSEAAFVPQRVKTPGVLEIASSCVLEEEDDRGDIPPPPGGAGAGEQIVYSLGHTAAHS